VKDGNYNNNRELYLVHVRDPHSPFELDARYEQATLEKIFYLWGRPVHLETDDMTEAAGGGSPQVARVLDTYDGTEHKSVKI
jgi:spore cortex formation protein SpoVR/YcgB (stage V sporulation)